MEIEQVLIRYTEIQAQEQALKEEKTLLQERIAAHTEKTGQEVWYPVVAGWRLKVRCRKSVAVEYDEEKLRERLGSRYTAILAPDPRKIRQHLPELIPTLTPLLPLIGSPSPDKVREAIQEGVVKTEEFTGAFRKTIRRYVAVGRVQPEGSLPE